MLKRVEYTQFIFREGNKWTKHRYWADCFAMFPLLISIKKKKGQIWYFQILKCIKHRERKWKNCCEVTSSHSNYKQFGNYSHYTQNKGIFLLTQKEGDTAELCIYKQTYKTWAFLFCLKEGKKRERDEGRERLHWRSVSETAGLFCPKVKCWGLFQKFRGTALWSIMTGLEKHATTQTAKDKP